MRNSTRTAWRSLRVISARLTRSSETGIVPTEYCVSTKAHEPRELLRVQLGTAQHLHKLVEHAAQNVPELRQLLRPLRFAALPKRLRLPLQLLRQRDLRQIIVKCCYFYLNVSVPRTPS